MAFMLAQASGFQRIIVESRGFCPKLSMPWKVVEEF